MAVLVHPVGAEHGDERDEQARVAQRVDDVDLAEVVRAEAAEGLDEPLGGRAVVIRARVVLEVPALPGHASGVGAGHGYLDATSIASASVNAPA